MDPTSPSVAPTPQDTEAYDLEKGARDYRKARRKARERAGEIKELNITAMMDMMTIILVFLLKSYTASSTNVSMTDKLSIPNSTTQLNPKDDVNVTITTAEITVNDKTAAAVVSGIIPAEYRAGKQANNPLVVTLYEALKKEVEKQKYIAKYNTAAPFAGRVNIISDKRIPYQTLLAVLYTAGQAELGEYKFMVMKGE